METHSKKEIRKLVKHYKSKESKASLMKKTMISFGKDAIDLGVADMDVVNLVSPNESMKGIVLAKKAVDNFQKSRKFISTKTKPKLEISENLLKGSGKAGKALLFVVDSSEQIKLMAQGSKMIGGG